MFLETPRFPSCPSFGFVSEPMYSVTIVQTASGYEKRNRNWSRPLHRYTATVGPRAEAEIAEVLKFWHAVGGRAYGFRFKDYVDFKSCDIDAITTATDQPTYDLDSTGTTFQMRKEYVAGVNIQVREIKKPVQGTILVAVNGTPKTETTDYTIDYATGIITFGVAQPAEPTWGGEFDVPARFDSEMPVEVSTYRIQSCQFAMMELRL